MSETSETIKAIRLFGVWKVLYWRFAYARHMRWIHRRGRHQFTHMHPFDGPAQDWCQWCGYRVIDPPVSQRPQPDHDHANPDAEA